MSNIVAGIAQRRRVGSPTRKAILMHLAAIASDDGSGIWTSKANMARDLEMGRRTVQENIDKLAEMGVVRMVGSRSCKNGFTVEYRIDLDALEALEDTRAGAAPVREPHMTRAPAAHEPVREPHPNLPLTIHEPSEEPPLDPPPKKSRPKRAVAIPENWVPSDANIAHALSKNFTHQEIQDEADKFRDHHLAKGTRFKDWDAGWRTWCANAIKFGNIGVARKQVSGGYGRGSSVASVVARRRAQGEV